MYLRYTTSNRPTKTRRARPLSARMRRETRGRYRRKNHVRRGERNTYHAVNATQSQGLNRGAEGVGGRAICRRAREKERNTAKKNVTVRHVEHGIWRGAIGWTVSNNQNANKYASVGPLVERQTRKSLILEETKNTAQHYVRVREVGPEGLTWDHGREAYEKKTVRCDTM